MGVMEELMYFKVIQDHFEAIESEKIVLDQEIEIIAISSRPARYMIVHPKASRLLLTNMTGRMILDLCISKRTITIGDIRQRILSELQTNIDPALVLLDIVKFLRMAEQQGIVHGSLS
jgi:hypothetical protein